MGQLPLRGQLSQGAIIRITPKKNCTRWRRHTDIQTDMETLRPTFLIRLFWFELLNLHLWQTAYCTLLTAHCILHTTHCILHLHLHLHLYLHLDTLYYTLKTVNYAHTFILSAAHVLLHNKNIKKMCMSCPQELLDKIYPNLAVVLQFAKQVFLKKKRKKKKSLGVLCQVESNQDPGFSRSVVMHCIVYCIRHCTALHALHCTTLNYMHCIALHCTTCTALHYTALHALH